MMKSNIFNIINRWRHTLGYGVHSPLAYRIIKECVHPDSRYAYYADSRIDYLFDDDWKKRQQLRLLIRIINILHVKLLWMPNCGKKTREIISETFPNLKVSTNFQTTQDADFIVISGIRDHSELWNRLAPKANAGLLIFNNKGLSAHKSEQTDLKFNIGSQPTLTLYGDYFTLYLRRDGMQKIEYDLL